MPYLKIQTNQNIEDNKKEDIILKVSKLLASELGKPETYIMVSFESNAKISFAGNCEPAAFMELKSIGLTEETTPALSKFLCGFANEVLSIDKDRVYIEFSGANGAMWGWNDRTF